MQFVLHPSIWLPTESGDFALNYLFGNIEESLIQNTFTIDTAISPSMPLTSDINIVCSHGSKNISELQSLSQKSSEINNLDLVIGKGRILIFFVCYSGSMKTEFYRNNVVSLIKKYISKGYDAVIAPVWALDVSVPKYWLPEFLSSINNNLEIDRAVFNANLKVYEKYPTPAAWACLHLYGNPKLRIDKI